MDFTHGEVAADLRCRRSQHEFQAAGAEFGIMPTAIGHQLGKMKEASTLEA
jgi:hypothetical protein